MSAIRNNLWKSFRSVAPDMPTRGRNRLRCWHARLLCLWFCIGLALLTLGNANAADLEIPLKSIAQIVVDDDGRPLNYPASVFFDPELEEIYLINGSTSRVVVYGQDFFPLVSIGAGRGVVSPRGGLVTRNGEVYICQVRTAKNPRPRITILNGAFFVEREIFLDDIPEAEDFSPTQLALSRDGLIYLAGNNYPGILVLDGEGNFLRKIQPKDITGATVLAAERKEREADKAKAKDDAAQVTAATDQTATTAETEAAEEEPYANIPEEFRPRNSAADRTSGTKAGLVPVKISDVSIDSSGKIYLISLETSRIYVYGPDEKFLFAFGEKGGTPRHLSQPKGLAIDEKRGYIHVVDYMRQGILVYDMTGKFIFEYGGRGFAPGWFNYPNSIAINKQGQLIVADLFNKRVQVLEVGYEELFPKLGIGKDGKEISPDEESADDEATEEQETATELESSPAPEPEEPAQQAVQEEASSTPASEVTADEEPEVAKTVVLEPSPPKPAEPRAFVPMATPADDAKKPQSKETFAPALKDSDIKEVVIEDFSPPTYPNDANTEAEPAPAESAAEPAR